MLVISTRSVIITKFNQRKRTSTYRNLLYDSKTVDMIEEVIDFIKTGNMNLSYWDVYNMRTVNRETLENLGIGLLVVKRIESIITVLYTRIRSIYEKYQQEANDRPYTTGRTIFKKVKSQELIALMDFYGLVPKTKLSGKNIGIIKLVILDTVDTELGIVIEEHTHEAILEEVRN